MIIANAILLGLRAGASTPMTGITADNTTNKADTTTITADNG